jgi:hypothetical protein
MIIGAALVGLAAAAPLSAQRIPSRGNTQGCTYSRTSGVSDIIFGRSRNTATNCANPGNGGWYAVGSDGNGGTIYERQTRDSNGNLIIQRARRDRNGNFSVIGTRSVNGNGAYNNGRYNGSNNNGRYNNTGRYNNGAYNNGRDNSRYNTNRRYNDRNDGDDDDQGNGHGKGRGHGRGHDKGHKDHDNNHDRD